tara:strand:- start:1190 stop:2290 length:1101 start_codon:yes stop_codon:yes gene_type:complete
MVHEQILGGWLEGPSQQITPGQMLPQGTGSHPAIVMTISRVRPWLAAGALCLVSAVAGAASGPAPRQAMSDALFTGPLAAPNATALPKGHWDIEPYLIDSIQYASFDDDWSQTDVKDSHALRSVTLMQYGLTDRLSIALLPTFGYNIPADGSTSSGPQLGDMTVRAHYMLHKFTEGEPWPTFSLSYAQGFPTGKYDGLEGNTADGLGSGVLESTFGIFTQTYFWMPTGRILRTRLNATYTTAFDDASVSGVSVYGTPAGFEGQIDTGDSYAVNLAFEYSLTRHWVPAVDIIYSHSDGAAIRGVQAANGLSTPIRSTSGSSELVSIAPALEYNWNGHYGLIVGADVVVAGRNTAATVTPQAALNIYY